VKWKDIKVEKPLPFEVVLFCSKFVNRSGHKGLKYGTGSMLMNGKIALHHANGTKWEPTSWLRINLPFPHKTE